MKNFRHLFDGQSPEKSQLDDSALAIVQFFEPLEGVVQRFQVDLARFRRIDGFVQGERGYCGSTFDGMVSSRLVDQDARIS